MVSVSAYCVSRFRSCIIFSVGSTVKFESVRHLKLSSPLVQLVIHASPAPHGDLPPPLYIKLQHLEEELGVRIFVSSTSRNPADPLCW